jgi:ribosomal protein L11 methyltransferase
MWLWSKLSGVRWTDAWEERFYGTPNAVMTELKGGKSVRVEVYCGSEEDAEAIQAQFGGSVRRLNKAELEPPEPPVPPPLKIRGSLVISQERDEVVWKALVAAYPGRHCIRVPAEMAFGTGDHPTTATCLRFLVDEARKREVGSWRMLDLGCGSGVLAIAARLLGASSCLAMDFDPNAVEVALRNVGRNGATEVEVAEADVLLWNPKHRYEIVVANLFAGVLREAMPIIARALAPGGRLILSGILREQWPETREVAREAGFQVVEDRQRGKWMTALFRSAS